MKEKLFYVNHRTRSFLVLTENSEPVRLKYMGEAMNRLFKMVQHEKAWNVTAEDKGPVELIAFIIYDRRPMTYDHYYEQAIKWCEPLPC